MCPGRVKGEKLLRVVTKSGPKICYFLSQRFITQKEIEQNKVPDGVKGLSCAALGGQRQRCFEAKVFVLLRK